MSYARAAALGGFVGLVILLGVADLGAYEITGWPILVVW